MTPEQVTEVVAKTLETTNSRSEAAYLAVIIVIAVMIGGGCALFWLSRHFDKNQQNNKEIQDKLADTFREESRENRRTFAEQIDKMTTTSERHIDSVLKAQKESTERILQQSERTMSAITRIPCAASEGR